MILLSLPDSGVVEPVVLGDGGILECCRAGQVVVDLSTAAPSSTVRLHAALGARDVELIDAGISGGAAAAEQGTLTIMAGGSAGALAGSARCSTRSAPASTTWARAARGTPRSC